MKVRTFLGSALAVVALIVGSVACSTSNGDSGKNEDRLCTPGNNVFCRCADTSQGTKVCKDDGKSFEECTTGNGACAGGEIPDPNTGNPVDDAGNPEPEPKPTEPTGDKDSCPGASQALMPGQAVSFEGDTTGAKDDMTGRAGACAAGTGGPDHVYQLQPTGTGNVRITVQGIDTLNPVAYLRTTCADVESQQACAPPIGAGKTITLDRAVVVGQPMFLVIDGASGTKGKYKVTATLTAGAVCGDGKVDTGEACDDKNQTNDDGCNVGCQVINGNPTSGGTCPGQPVHVWPGKKVTGTGSTIPYGNTFTKTGSSCIVSANDLNVANDHVYEVTAHTAGNLTVTATPEAAFNLQLTARTTCATPASQGTNMCANNGSTGAAETMTFPVTNNQKVYVAVDGILNGKGTYNISFEIK